MGSGDRWVRITIDPSTFRGKKVPKALAGIGKNKKVSVPIALMHTAHRTRPPIMTGFHLSDWWAWLRYFPAIDASSDLRLCKDWEDIDPHQKTVLSDDFGMGFTTYLLTQAYGIKLWADTKYFMEVLDPNALKVQKTAKTGQYKSPDFIGIDAMGRLIIVECKGSQSSTAALRRAMKAGALQKRAPKVGKKRKPSVKIRARLVAGLFIPQFSSKEDALVRFIDPSWKSLERFLLRQDPRQLFEAAGRTDLAKCFALAGANSMASYLMRPGPLESALEPSLAEETRHLLRWAEQQPLLQAGPRVPDVSPLTHEARRLQPAAFGCTFPIEQLDRLLTQERPRETILEWFNSARDADWSESSEHQLDGEPTRFEVKTPLGVRLSVAFAFGPARRLSA